jgi:7-cyano-7-deazaguanine synthase in queuosine biosynthesis
MNASDLRGKTIAFAASGGLDSCTITHWLAKQGVNVVFFSADLGQPDESDFNAIEKRMIESGASAFIGIDLKNEMAEMGVSLVQGNSITGLLTRDLIDREADLRDTLFVQNFLRKHSIETTQNEIFEATSPSNVVKNQTSVGSTGPQQRQHNAPKSENRIA